MIHAADLIESVEALAALVETERKLPAMQARRDKATASGNRKIQKIVRARLRKQRTSVLSSISLSKIHAAINRTAARASEAAREVSAEDRDRITSEVTLALAAEVHGVPVTAAEQETFASAITQAVVSGEGGVSALLSSVPGDTESFVSEYLKNGGFTRLTGQIDKTTVDRIASAVADAYERGASFDQTVSAIKSEFSDMTSYRAKMIAQTELNDAYNQSIFHFGAAAGATRKSWETDLAPCPICIENALQGEIDIDEDFASGDDAPPSHPNCFLPGTPITALRVTGAFRRRYKGEICILSFSGLPDLSVTPNHPILTRLGWTPAGELKIHDYALQRSGPADTFSSTLVDPHHNYIETGIDQVFDSFALTHGGASSGVPISAEAFHGDSSADNKVDIVNSTRKLSLDRSERSKNFQYLDFADRRSLSSELARECGLSSLFDRCNSSPDGIVRSGGISLPLLGGQLGIAHELGRTGVSLLELERFPASENSGAADSDPIGNSEDAFPLQVRTVQLVKIERRYFDGHVYNLETESGTYFAGSILVHNCLCSLLVHANN